MSYPPLVVIEVAEIILQEAVLPDLAHNVSDARGWPGNGAHGSGRRYPT